MKKYLALLLAALCALSALSGCGSKKKTLEPRSFADDLLSRANFQDSLNELSAPVIPLLYNVDESDYTEALVYAGTASTAEEIAVFAASDDAAAARLLEAARARVENQLQAYRTYGPAQAMTLENAIVTRKGNTVVVVICSDTDSARKVVDEYI